MSLSDACRNTQGPQTHQSGPQPSPSVSIDVRQAWVEFPIFDAKSRSLKHSVLDKAGVTIVRTDSNVVVAEALRDITLSLCGGDRVGLVGHNGAGKSTLLRLMSGIYEPTRGAADIRGKVAPSFDLGVGMDPEVSSYENIIIRDCSWARHARRCRPRSTRSPNSAELGDFLSMPLRTYSTGMRVRLALGVVTSIDPEILLLDEAIGSIDSDFLRKALTRLQNLVARSGILVLAAHSSEFLARLCRTAIWLEHGAVRMIGGLEDVIRAYEGELAARHVAHVLAEDRHD